MSYFLLGFSMLCFSNQVRIVLGLDLDSFNLLKLHIKQNCSQLVVYKNLTKLLGAIV